MERDDALDLRKAQQCIWNMLTQLGIDTDGDTSPSAQVTTPEATELFYNNAVSVAHDIREEYEVASDDASVAEAELARLRREIAALCEKWGAYEEGFDCADDIRALLAADGENSEDRNESTAEAELARLREDIQAVHRQDLTEEGHDICLVCNEAWPCVTIRILSGDSTEGGKPRARNTVPVRHR